MTQLLEGRQGPAIGATDYIRAYPKQIRALVPMRYTHGFGRSDTRANLRRHFEVARFHIAHAAIAGGGREDDRERMWLGPALRVTKLGKRRHSPS